MTNSTTFLFLKNILLTFVELDEDAITPDTQLEDLAIDSLDYVQIQVEARKRFGIMINFAVLSEGHIRTLGDFTAYLDKLILEKELVAT
ncbi:MAG: acyl carrier protein [Oligoflexus sp.]|jgi:acyl carrier protein